MTRTVLLAALFALVSTDFVLGVLFGVFLPAGTPSSVTERLQRGLPAVSQNPDAAMAGVKDE